MQAAMVFGRMYTSKAVKGLKLQPPMTRGTGQVTWKG